MKYLVLVLITLPLVVLGQDPAPAPDLFDKILALLGSAMGASATVGIVIEFVLRLFKSEKPLSIAHAVAAIVRKIADIVGVLADLLDKVLPQRVK